MLKIVSVCAALILAAATFSTSAVAQKGGLRKMSFARWPRQDELRRWSRQADARWSRQDELRRWSRQDGLRWSRQDGLRWSRQRCGYGGPGKMGYGGPGIYGGGKYASGYGRGYGYRYPYRRHGGYWPWWGVGAGLAVAATGAYYGGYGYGYDDCVQWRPDWGWVNVSNIRMAATTHTDD